MDRMPVLFVGHGSPMNAISVNAYTNEWKRIAKSIPRPRAILSFSAHWYTKGTKIMNSEDPKTVHDIYGFPQELYDLDYRVNGAPWLSRKASELITKTTQFDQSWGIDHGTWSVLVHMYPERDVPVVQVSIDAEVSLQEQYEIGCQLKTLREQGVLIFASGNIVHNLGRVNWEMPEQGYEWANEFDHYIYENIMSRNHDGILNYPQLGSIAHLAVPTQDHFLPLLVALGASDDTDQIEVFNQSGELGSLSMTSYLIGV